MTSDFSYEYKALTSTWPTASSVAFNGSNHFISYVVSGQIKVFYNNIQPPHRPLPFQVAVVNEKDLANPNFITVTSEQQAYYFDTPILTGNWYLVYKGEKQDIQIAFKASGQRATPVLPTPPSPSPSPSPIHSSSISGTTVFWISLGSIIAVALVILLILLLKN